jgi:hypothetical protein
MINVWQGNGYSILINERVVALNNLGGADFLGPALSTAENVLFQKLNLG